MGKVKSKLSVTEHLNLSTKNTIDCCFVILSLHTFYAYQERYFRD